MNIPGPDSNQTDLSAEKMTIDEAQTKRHWAEKARDFSLLTALVVGIVGGLVTLGLHLGDVGTTDTLIATGAGVGGATFILAVLTGVSMRVVDYYNPIAFPFSKESCEEQISILLNSTNKKRGKLLDQMNENSMRALLKYISEDWETADYMHQKQLLQLLRENKQVQRILDTLPVSTFSKELTQAVALLLVTLEAVKADC